MGISITALFIAATNHFNLPPGLIDSVCYVETKWDTTSIHHDDGGTDSIGVCQVKLKTAVWLGYTGGEEGLLDPAINVYYAAAYLAFQNERYHDVTKAIVAYNRGNAYNLTNSAYSDKVIRHWQTYNRRGFQMAFKRKVDSGGGDVVKFEKIGDSVQGTYLGAQLDPNGKFGPALKHVLSTPKGTKVIFSKPNSQLSSLLMGEEGRDVIITFENTKASGKGNPTKIYAIDIDDAPPIPKDELPSFSNEEESDDDTAVSDPDEEDAAQAAQLAALERAARTKALLNGKGKSKN